MAEYELFVDAEASKGRSLRLDELEAKAARKEEAQVELRDPATLETIRARAILAMTPEELPGGATLWLVQTSGRFPKPWGIEIVERFEEEDDEVKALPRRKLSLAERKGKILSDLLKERDEKMGEGKKDGSEK